MLLPKTTKPDNRTSGTPNGCRLSLSKIPFGAFRQFFAVCCAHNLFAVSEQIPHLQPEKYFPPGARPDGKYLLLCFPLTRKILRSFFYSLKRHPKWVPLIFGGRISENISNIYKIPKLCATEHPPSQQFIAVKYAYCIKKY